MKQTIKFHEVPTANGNIFRADFKVGDKEFTAHMGINHEWLNIIDDQGRCEQCIIDSDGDVVSAGGECATEAWTDDDWIALTKSVNNTREKRLHVFITGHAIPEMDGEWQVRESNDRSSGDIIRKEMLIMKEIPKPKQ